MHQGFEHRALSLPTLPLFPSSAPCCSIAQSPKAWIQAHRGRSNRAFHVSVKTFPIPCGPQLRAGSRSTSIRKDSILP